MRKRPTAPPTRIHPPAANSPEQRDLFQETWNVDLGAIEAEVEQAAPTVRAKRQSAGRQPLPEHLPRIEHRHEPESCTCGQCGKAYLAYLSSLTCPCGAPACEAHHLIAAGFGGGMGTKASDVLAFPICRACHEAIHYDVTAWEEKNSSQWKHICMALHQAISEGVLTL